MTSTKPQFRKPWTHGAHAYPEADTFAALGEGMKRMRKMKMVKMPNSGEAGSMPCAKCGVALRDASPTGAVDVNSTWTWLPEKKMAYGMHYECSWMSLMQEILDLGRVIRF